MPCPLVLAVTGGIGAGKSVVRRLLTLLTDCPAYDSDSRAKALYRVPEVHSAVTRLLGCDPINPARGLNKEILRRALTDERLREPLEAVVHRAVRQDFARYCASTNRPIVLLETAILFHSGLDALTDRILLVEASGEQRADRAARRGDEDDNFGTMDRLQREELRRCSREADFRIDNSGSRSLILQCEEIISKLREAPTL